jgi:molecular chaperone GrpE (heat shock protein)
MNQIDFTHKLQSLMQQVGISSFKSLSRTAGVSERQILQMRQGNIHKMRLEILIKLSQVLHVSLDELVESFSGSREVVKLSEGNSQDLDLRTQLSNLQTEYHRLNTLLQTQQQILQQEFQQSSIQILESLLLQWPTAAQRAKENPELAAVKVVPLIQKPLEKLLQTWGIEAIAHVGAQIPYDPQQHQLLEGAAKPGDLVQVRYLGYRQGEKLLYRAKVSPINNSL